MRALLWHQGSETGDEVERLEDDVRGAIAVRCLELVTHLAIGGERQAFFRHCWAGNVAAQTFQLPAFIRPGHHTGMQREPGDLSYLVIERLIAGRQSL